MSIVTLTLGVSTDDPITNYGFVFYDEVTTGYPGAPFGAVAPPTLYGFDIVYLAFGPSGGGFVFSLWTTDGAGAPGTTPDELAFTFESISFVDDDSSLWTFNRADALNPAGSTFSFGPDDVREFAWSVDPSALPVVTPGNDYAINIDEPEPPPDSGGGDTGGGGDSLPGMYPPIYDVCAADTAVLALMPDTRGGVRLYPFGEAPQNDPHTYAVWQIVHGEPADNSLSCTPALDFYGVQVDVYAYTADAARAAAQALRNAIETAAYVVAYRGESRDAATQAYRVSFLSEWHTPRA